VFNGNTPIGTHFILDFFLSSEIVMLWQPLVTKINDYTSSKSLNMDIKWEVHKRTQQGVSAKLESYIYVLHMVHANNNLTCSHVYALFSYLSYILLKATMLYTCALRSSSRFFHHVLGLWHHIMWHIMWLLCYIPLYHPK